MAIFRFSSVNSKPKCVYSYKAHFNYRNLDLTKYVGASMASPRSDVFFVTRSSCPLVYLATDLDTMLYQPFLLFNSELAANTTECFYFDKFSNTFYLTVKVTRILFLVKSDFSEKTKRIGICDFFFNFRPQIRNFNVLLGLNRPKKFLVLNFFGGTEAQT